MNTHEDGSLQLIRLQFVDVAASRNYDTRTGFTLTLPDGSRAEDNAELIAAAMRIVSQALRAVS